MQVYWLEGNNPFLNLSIEDSLLRQSFGEPCLMIWKNNPCLVIGRGQNPWQECDMAYLKRAHIPLVRRQTGGGAVYHDQGNLNLSLLHPGPVLNKKILTQIISDTLHRLGCSSIHTTERGDLTLKGLKIVGSAYRITSTNTLHHASLLFDADLSELRRALHLENTPHIDGKSVPSVRSSVTTIRTHYPNLTWEALLDQLRLSFFDFYHKQSSALTHLSAEDMQNDPIIHARFLEYQSPEWRLGKTPPFTTTWLDLKTQTLVRAVVEKGRIQSIDPPTFFFQKIGEFYDIV